MQALSLVPPTCQLADYEQAADLLGVSPDTVRKLVARRRIRFVKVGRLTKIPFSAIEEFIEANTVQVEGAR